MRIKVFTVTYRYDVFRDAATNYYTGFKFDPETVVTLAKLPIEGNESPNLIRFLLDCIDLKFNHISRPDQCTFSGHGDARYEIGFKGGEFEVTYNATLFFSCYNGQLIDTTEKTIKFDYTYATNNEDG